MQQEVRKTPSPVSHPAVSDDAFPEWKYKFILRKLALKRGERVLVISPCDEIFVRMLAQQVGELGRIDILTDHVMKSAMLKQQYADLPSVQVLVRGPAVRSVDYQAVVWLGATTESGSDMAREIQFSWRLLAKCGRLLLAIPQQQTDSAEALHEAMEIGNGLGFVTRMRRCCDDHRLWIGVKYLCKT
ncbi:hypothetical protein SAMN04488540_102224 [Ferrimonas sediminum]|uniref:Uncharacterized protein n=1 Tax=Ferrimonas sediminum TaxID=718193 RepID=A0A1G8M0N4_9GAMM|nr:hypothetical protein [Ferrimonas sediminum]SDI61307.1 hypothetical protein SAMN04488540_102224 [Ferrimonas sediminum]